MKNTALKTGFLLLIAYVFINTGYSQVPAGFNYQAIARDGSGNPITGQSLKVRIGILTSLTPETVIYEAEHNVTTNQFGLFTLMVGDPSATPVTGTFSAISWTVQPLYLRTRVWWNSAWQVMGSSQLLSVPYAIVAQGVSGLNKLSVAGITPNLEEALFEVKNNLGETVFAVYNEGVRVGVGDGSKGTKGGFAIGSFGGAKAYQEYLRVTSDSTRIYVKDAEKGVKGGFAIGGFTGAKAGTGNYIDITQKNYFIGHESGSKITTGLYNSVLGYQAARNITSGSFNTILGRVAGYSISGGNNNIVIGELAGYSMTTGNHNTLIGSSAGYGHSNQEYNVMIGTSAGYHINASGWNGSFNTFMGINSGYAIQNSRDNTFIGTNSGYWLENGSGNTFVGIDAGRAGNDRTWAPGSNVANYNTFIGTQSGRNIVSGSKNVSVGYQSGFSGTTGTGNVFIGYQAGYSEAGSDKLYISNSSANNLVYGDFAAKKLGINTTTLSKTFNVGGDAQITGTLTAGLIIANVDGDVTGKVNGSTNGRFTLTESGTIMKFSDDKIILNWEKDGNWIDIINTHALICSFWYRKQNRDVSSGNSGFVNPGSSTKIITEVNIPYCGYEIHMSTFDGSSTCTVWIQVVGETLVGHYTIY
jgi:hypothetical protein